MALAEAILVCLTRQGLTGYELAKVFDTSIGFFWHATHQQIYRELKKLEAANHVTSERVVQEDRPNKKVYAITDAGRARLRAWSREPSAPPPIKDDLLTAFYALEHVDIAALRDRITARLATHRERLALYELIRERRYTDVPDDDLEHQGKLMGLKVGLLFETSSIAWCEEAISNLDRLIQTKA